MRELSIDKIREMEEKFLSDDSLIASMNAASLNGISKVSLNPQSLILEPFNFNVDIKQGKITNQKSSGRCWMFAGLNLMRNHLIKNLNLETFELSQSYTLFFDKLERANYFLENMIENCEEELDGRLLHFLLSDPLSDGGQWDMFVNLIKKYGIVPKYAYPESFNSSNTSQMNKCLCKILRKYTLKLREAKSKGEDEIYAIKSEAMQKVYDILVTSLGEPPIKFDFVVHDKDDKLIEERNISPQDFFKKYIGIEIDDYISIINAPTKDKPYNKTYTVKYLGNIIEGREIKHLNLEIEELEKAAVNQLKDGQPVWFGCDVGQWEYSDKERAILDTKSQEYEKLFQVDLSLDKADALDYGDSLMTHAMTFLGVHLDENGNAMRWKVENSWGDDYGYNGYLVMTKDWFEKYMYQVVVNKKYLTDEQKKLYEQEPIILNPWDPMGSLAK